MKLVEVGTDDLTQGARVVAEYVDGERATFVQDADDWRIEETGRLLHEEVVEQVEALLWLHRREERRKAGGVEVVFTDHGRLVAGVLGARGAGGDGATTVSFAESPTPQGPSWLQLAERLGRLPSTEEFLGAQQGVRSGEAVLTQRAIEQMGAVMVEDAEPRDVRLHRAVMAVLVEPLWDVEVRLELFPETPPTLVEAEGRNWWVARSASTEGLRQLREAITAELTRRGEE